MNFGTVEFTGLIIRMVYYDTHDTYSSHKLEREVVPGDKFWAAL